MFSIFKPQKTLSELIPNDYVDIHSHVMSGIDDGAKNEEDTLFLVESLQKIGAQKIITSPHTFSGFWNNTFLSIKEKEEETLKLFNKNSISIPFKTASEYLLDDHFVSLFQKNEILTLKDNFVLVEMSYLNMPINLFDIIFEMQVAGYIPVLAHPERYQFFHSNFENYRKLKNAGCFFQLNLLSTVGYYGKEVLIAAEKLLKSGLIDYVGSDVHHKKHIAAFSEKIKIKDSKPLEEAFTNNQFFSF